MNFLLRLFIKGYQLMVSPLLGNHCKYTPSCSNYALVCLQKHRTLKAIWLIFLRILRCSPFGKGGYDPVP